MTAQQLAEDCAAALWRGDAASAGLGMVVEAVAPGAARVAMGVTAAMLNGVGTCHGGFIFALADSAFAFACNTHGPVAVAAHCTISFLHPAREGDRLVAEAAERHREGRSGITDVRVATAAGVVIAEFRGQSRTTGGVLAHAS